jgi:acetyltransferase-like isoleucine patch superfamily enzyme
MQFLKIFYHFFKDSIALLLNWIILKRYFVQYEADCSIKGVVWIDNKGVIKIGKKFRGNSGENYNPIGGDTKLRLIALANARITIGDNCSISNSTIIARENVNIGNHVFIGGGCKIWDNDFHSLHSIERESVKDFGIGTLPIQIGNHVFIGGSSIILKGVNIGDYSIVGAGSVVRRSIPSFEIWAGNPAVFVKKVKVEIS